MDAGSLRRMEDSHNQEAASSIDYHRRNPLGSLRPKKELDTDGLIEAKVALHKVECVISGIIKRVKAAKGYYLPVLIIKSI